MSQPTVSLHPYFKVHPGQLDAARALLPRFVERTASEPACRGYEFTMNGDEVFCREAYADAAGTLAHVTNVGDLLGEMLKIADLVRLEVHGPAAELAQLKGPLGDLQPAWFEWVCGVESRH